MTDHQTDLRQLRELNAKRTPGPLHTGGFMYLGGKPRQWLWTDAEPGQQSGKVVAKDLSPSDADFIAALANACEPSDTWLLDAAERGIETDYGTAMTIDSLTAKLASVEAELDRLRGLLRRSPRLA